MKTFLAQLKWQFFLLAKNNIITISFLVTLFYGVTFYFFKDLEAVDKILTLLIMNDPAIIGLAFIGIIIILERKQGVLDALFVTPINPHIYLITRVLSLSIIGWLCALGMAFAALGSAFHFIHFSIGVFSICVLCCLAGIYIVAYNDEFMKFLLWTIPILLLVVNLPMLKYFGLINWKWLDFTPVMGSLFLIDNSFTTPPNFSEIKWGYISVFFWIIIGYFFVFEIFQNKVINS